MFKRRRQRGWFQSTREFFVPSSGYRRAGRYFVRRVLRLSGSPHAIAAGVAAGAFASFTPFIGFHFLLSFVVAFVIGGNMLAAALGTAFGNPVTFPLIWAVTYQIGSMILGEAGDREPARIGESLLTNSVDAIWPLVKTMLIGGVPLGLVVGAVVYVLTRIAVRGFQRARRARLAERAKARAEAVFKTSGLGAGERTENDHG